MITDLPADGLCQAWTSAEDVLECCDATPDSTDLALFDSAAVQASLLLFELTGERYSGICERTVRPCPGSCGCFDPFAPYGYLWGYDGWGRRVARGGCRPLSTVKLAGYVQEIIEVQIDGAVISAGEYRVDRHRDLVRLADANGKPQRWPGCQRLDIPAGEVGTFTVEYSYGQGPPLGGVLAARQLACELVKACPSDSGVEGECALPSGTVRVDRQGITVEVDATKIFLVEGPTGLLHLDTFLGVYGKQPRRSVLMSPEITPFAQEA